MRPKGKPGMTYNNVCTPLAAQSLNINRKSIQSHMNEVTDKCNRPTFKKIQAKTNSLESSGSYHTIIVHSIQ